MYGGTYDAFVLCPDPESEPCTTKRAIPYPELQTTIIGESTRRNAQGERDVVEVEEGEMMRWKC